MTYKRFLIGDGIECPMEDNKENYLEYLLMENCGENMPDLVKKAENKYKNKKIN